MGVLERAEGPEARAGKKGPPPGVHWGQAAHAALVFLTRLPAPGVRHGPQSCCGRLGTSGSGIIRERVKDMVEDI